MADQIEVT